MTGRWFHANLSGDAAEHILTDKGVEGTFLVRPSENTPGHFTISVLHNGAVTHIKIQNDGDCYFLAGGPDPFATLSGLVNYYVENPGTIRLRQGEVVTLRQPLISEDPTTERWFHGPLKSKDAETLLLRRGKIGNFLVRESQSQPGQYVLSVRCETGVTHVIIKNRGGKYDVGSGLQFDSLVGLVNFYKQNPKLRDIRDQTLIILDEPFHSTSFVTSAIGERINQLQRKGKSASTGFREEFEKLQYYDMKEGVYSNIEGQREEVKSKNRYKNILPYDHSRVVLRGRNNKKEGNGYINANYVNSELRNNEVKYIACQGPLPASIEDFWFMCYQERVKVIVMLTNPIERGKTKCAQYWPDLGLTEEHGKLVVDNMLEHNTKNFTVRELRLYHKERGQEPPRMVYQYHYTEWPDHGAPENPDTVLGLLSEMHSRNEDDNIIPIVVHCSAGIGRTGTVIAIDVLMHLIEEQGLNEEIDVLKTTQLLRSQRAGMIQTEFQYRFVYLALEQFVEVEKIRRGWQPLQSLSMYSNLPSPDGSSDSPSLPRASHSISVEVFRPPMPNKPAPRIKTEKAQVQQSSPKRSNALHGKTAN